MKNIAVVSLIDEHERRQHIDALFKKNELDFDYFDAINTSQVAATLQKYGLSINTDRMSLGEVACYLSHYCLWQRVIEQNMPYLMIFEDDIHFAKSANQLLKESEWLPDGFDIIKLETTYEAAMLKNKFELSPSHSLFHMKSRHLGSGGYIISYKGAQRLIGKIREQGIHIPIDHLVFENLINESDSNVYQIIPAICIQDIIYNKDSLRFGSGLEKERKPKPKSKPTLSAGQKANREMIRLWKQLKINDTYRTSLLTAKGYKLRVVDYQE